MKIVIILCVLINSYSSFAQYEELARFGIAEGLPSNHLYDCVEDDQGFLWIATDAGVARFDGKYFQIFTTENGLPDNDVIQIVKERNGQIWVNCFNRTLAYFDKEKNRFISALEDAELAKIKGTGICLLSELKKGGIIYHDFQGVQLFYKKTYYSLLNEGRNLLNQGFLAFNSDNTRLYFGIIDNMIQLRQVEKSKVVGRKMTPIESGKGYFKVDYKQNMIFYYKQNDDQVFVFKNLSIHPLNYTIDTIRLSNQLKVLGYKDKYMSVINMQDEIAFYDKKNFKFLFRLHGDFKPNSTYIDKHENIWVNSIDKGLILFKQQQISHLKMPVSYQQIAYLSVNKIANGPFFLGNYSGEVFEIEKSVCKKHLIHHNGYFGTWIRNTQVAQQKVFNFSDAGIYLNYAKQLKFPSTEVSNNLFPTAKTAIKLSDSIIISGGIQGLLKINTISEKLTKLNSNNIRVTTLASIDKKDIIYFGSNDGLYKYSLKSNASPIKNYLLPFNERVTAVCFTNDSLLWVSTSSKGLYVFWHDKVVATFDKRNGLASNNIITLSNGSEGQIWVGTNNGISIVKYLFEGRLSLKNIHNLSENDGLSSNSINQLYYHHDTMYAATGRGVSIIPASISISPFDISVQLVNVQINQQDTAIKLHYQLASTQNNINLQVAGVELSGHFKNAQFSISEGITWTDFKSAILSLQLQSGKHNVWLRAIDVNGNIGTKILKMQFEIATPYYQTWWFLLGLGLLISTVVIWRIVAFIKQKHLHQLAELMHQRILDEMEIQALKSQMNPHFIFNCLNAIKGFIYEENFEKANQYLNNFSKLLRNTLDYSTEVYISLKAEMDYIRTYLLLEKQRFENKFDFSISIENDIDQDVIQMPSMLLQPFVENAIYHGFRHLNNRQGKLAINVYLVNDKLEVSIEDDGVGRKFESSLKRDIKDLHQSKGLIITNRRLELYHIELVILDKENEKGEASGTLVVLKIPISGKKME